MPGTFGEFYKQLSRDFTSEAFCLEARSRLAFDTQKWNSGVKHQTQVDAHLYTDAEHKTHMQIAAAAHSALGFLAGCLSAQLITSYQRCMDDIPEQVGVKRDLNPFALQFLLRD